MRIQSRLQFRSIFRVKVSNPETGALIGYVGDVSENGLKILSDTEYEVGADVKVRMRMRINETETLQFDLSLTCMWTGTNSKTGYFEAGFILAQPSAEFTLMVEKMRIQRGEVDGVD